MGCAIWLGAAACSVPDQPEVGSGAALELGATDAGPSDAAVMADDAGVSTIPYDPGCSAAGGGGAGGLAWMVALAACSAGARPIRRRRRAARSHH